MKRYFIGRIMALIPTLVGISLIAFLLGILSPGNPAEIALGKGGYEPTPEQIKAMEQKLGLDRPYHEQYLNWLNDIVHGDFGKSHYNNRAIGKELGRRLPITLRLALFSFGLTCFFGIGWGVMAAWTKGTWLERLIMTGINMVLSLPTFWIGLVLILVFAENLKALPTSGYGGIRHMILPSITLSCIASATIARLMRGALLAEFGKDYYIVASTRGITKKQLIIDNALPNALVPILPMIGNYLGGVLGGTVIIESIFAMPGIGSYAIESIGARDYPALQGYVLITGLIFVGVNLFVDLLGIIISPKVRLGEVR